MKTLSKSIETLLPELTALRHALHACPELAYHEHETAGRIAARLEAIPGMRVTRGVGGTGVVGLLGADRPGPCVALRADMDALPITECSGLPYASRNPGCMHACGHDGHITCLVGAAIVLAAHAAALPGPVKFIFQPAEESGGGALKMRDAGVLEDPPVQAIFALHDWPWLPLGQIGLRSGPCFASTDALDIVLEGLGGHAAMPHQTDDLILAGAHVVTALQSIVARQIAPTEALVISIATFQGGTARNVMPATVRLSGTMRALNENVRRLARERIRRVVNRTAAAFGIRARTRVAPGYPMMVNHAAAVAHVTRVAQQEPMVEDVITDLPPTLGGEDFAYFAEAVPAALWCLGIGQSGTPVVGLHHPRFDFNDAALPLGVKLHCLTALNFNRFPPAQPSN